MNLGLEAIGVIDEFAAGVPDEIVEPLVALEGVDLSSLGLTEGSEDRGEVVLVEDPEVRLPELQNAEDILVGLHGGDVLGEQLGVSAKRRRR